MIKLLFDKEAHRYTYDGFVIPSVTQVLAPLVDLSGIPAHILEHARARGEAVHKATEYYDMGILNIETLHPEVRPYVDAWIKLKQEAGLEVELLEARLFHPKMRYAGTVDRIGIIDGKKAIVDIKCTAKAPPYAEPQTAAYREAYNWQKPANKKAETIWTAHLKKDGTYELIPHKPSAGLSAFKSCLTIHNWKQSKGV